MKWFLVLTLLLAALPVSAQDGDSANLEYISAAYDNLFASGSFRAEVEQTSDQIITADNDEDTVLTATADSEILANVEDGQFTQMSVFMEISTESDEDETQEFEFALESILLDDTTYVRIGGLSDVLQGAFPEGWFDLSDPETNMGMEAGLSSTLTQLQSLLMYPLDESTVASVTELPEDDVDGEDVRVFEVTLLPAALLAHPILENPQEMAGSVDESFLENVTYTQRVYINSDDLPVLVEIDVLITDLPAGIGGTVLLKQDTEISVEFSEIGEPVTIEAPTLGE
jgi:hypothetical protein